MDGKTGSSLRAHLSSGLALRDLSEIVSSVDIRTVDACTVHVPDVCTYTPLIARHFPMTVIDFFPCHNYLITVRGKKLHDFNSF